MEGKEKMLRDNDAFPMPERYSDLDRDIDIEEQHYENDDLDDIFGSEPSSPSFHEQGNAEYSDIPRLKEKHETEGYRDGVTKGKVESVQVGFDEGYNLGAVLGLRIGKILGLLEGIYKAVLSAEGGEWDGEKGRLEGLWADAKRELGTESVFGREWWGEDGVWRFDVPGEKEREVVFEDVARAHPLVRKWEGVVDGEVKRWGLDLGVMDGEDEGEGGGSKADIVGRKDVNSTKEVASEPITSPTKIMGVSKAELNW